MEKSKEELSITISYRLFLHVSAAHSFSFSSLFFPLPSINFIFHLYASTWDQLLSVCLSPLTVPSLSHHPPSAVFNDSSESEKSNDKGGEIAKEAD